MLSWFNLSATCALPYSQPTIKGRSYPQGWGELLFVSSPLFMHQGNNSLFIHLFLRLLCCDAMPQPTVIAAFSQCYIS